MKRAPLPIGMWAVIIIGRRSEWINWNTLRRTRAECATAYMEDWNAEYREKLWRERNKTWRTARVTVSA